MVENGYLIKGIYSYLFFYSLEKINLPMDVLTKKNCFIVRKVISKYCKKKINFKRPNDLLIDKKKNLRYFTGKN